MDETVIINGQEMSTSDFLNMSPDERDELDDAAALEESESERDVSTEDPIEDAAVEVEDDEVEPVKPSPRRAPEPKPTRKIPVKPKPKVQREVFEPTSQPSGIDWRGIPLRMYMGTVRPYFKKLDPKTRQLLRTEIEGEMKNITAAYSDLVFPIYPNDIDMDILYHDYYTKYEIARARNTAMSWQQMIIGISAMLEAILLVFGVEQVRDFTNTQIKTMRIYQSLIIEMSIKNKGGAFAILPPELKIGIMLTLNAIFYIGAQWLMSGNKNSAMYERVVNTVYGFWEKGMGGATTPAPAPTTTGTSPIPRAPVATAMPDMMTNLTSNFGPVISGLQNLFGQFNQGGGGAAPPAGSNTTATPATAGGGDAMNNIANMIRGVMNGLGNAGQQTPAPAPGRDRRR